MKSVYTTCRYCESNCALEVMVEDNKVQKIVADKKNSHTWQDACSKGLTAQEMVEHPRRIKTPMKRIGDKYVEVSYEQAISEIATQLNDIRRQHGDDAIAFYMGNPIGFTSSVTMTMGFVDSLNTSNCYNASSIDQNNNHVVTEAMFGLTFLPLSPDVEHSDYMLLIGMNPAESKFGWLGNITDGWTKARKAMKERDAKVVVVDPRKTKTASQASQHIAITPGTDWAFLLGLVKVILENSLEDKASIQQLEGSQVSALKDICADLTLEELSHICTVSAETMKNVAKGYAAAQHAMCITQTGVSMHDTGTIGHWLGLVLEVITGNLDRKGSRFWQPGVINMTKLIKDESKPETLSRVRKLRTVLSNRALAELPDEINTPGPGQPKALFIQCGNPVVSGPDGKALDEAIEKLDLVIAVDLVQRESHRHADWLIPGEHWLERKELNYLLSGGNNQPHVQLAQQAVKAPEGIRPEWEFFIDLALEMKTPFLGRKGVNSLIRFSRFLSKAFNKPDWAFSPTLLTKLILLADKKVSWKDLEANPHGINFEEKSYGQLAGQMDGRKIQLAPEAFVKELKLRLASSINERKAQSINNGDDYPFLMFGKRDLNMMNSWLMELPNKQKREMSNACEIHHDDAQRLAISEGQRVKVSSPLGAIELAAHISTDILPGTLCIQHGWGSRTFNPANPKDSPEQFGVNKNVLINNTDIDPFSGTPKLNSTRVNVEPVQAAV